MADLTMSNLRELALALGASFCGAADLASAQELIRQLGGELTTPYPRALIDLVALLHDPEPHARSGAARAIACTERQPTPIRPCGSSPAR